MQIVTLLQIEPQIGPVAAQFPSRNAMPGVTGCSQDIVKRLTRNAEQSGDIRLGPNERRQNFLAEKLTGMHRRQSTLRGLSGHLRRPQ
jgi:hypothetical protein